MKLFTEKKKKTIFRACATRLLLGGGAGKEAKCPVVESVSSDRQSCVRSMQGSELSKNFVQSRD